MMACWENLNNKSGWAFSSRKATRVTIKDLKLPQDIDNKTLIPEIVQEMHFGFKKNFNPVCEIFPPPYGGL